MRKIRTLLCSMPGIHLSGMLFFIQFVSLTGFSQATPQGDQIGSLLRNKSYFEARDLYDAKKKTLSPVEQLHLGALIDNAFNRLEASNTKIAQLRKSFPDQLTDSVKFHLLELQQSNFVRLHQYKAAATSIQELLDTYPLLLTDEAIADYRNTRNMWLSLSEAPRQEVIVREQTVIQLERDKANLQNMPVRSDSVTISFIFDTGANLSTVTESTAKRLNMRMTDSGVEVNSITGLKVQSKVAVCPEFTIGSIVVRNAVFLVFPDSALYIPQISYQINGIIGFPVIEGMKEVRITRSGTFIVPMKREQPKRSNMALDFLTPILQLGDESYTFDSGATSTMLYRHYYEKHRKAIQKRYREESLEYGGAGGMIARPGFKIVWRPEVGGTTLRIPDVMVFPESRQENEVFFYGNIGQDVIQQFETMILNFESMFVRFE